jgi:hypothetical protein
MPPKSDIKRTNENSGEFSMKPSNAVNEAFLVYEAFGGAEIDTLRQQADETIRIVYDFGKELVEGTYETAFLSPIIQELNSPDKTKKDAAWIAINQYASDNPDNVEYVRAFAYDIGIKIPRLINSNYDARTEIEPGKLDTTPPLQDILVLMSPIKTRLVKNPQGANIESALITAAMADTVLKRELKEPGSVSEDILLKTLFTVESILEPLMEIIGYDGLVMSLKEHVDLIHFKRSDDYYDGITAETLAFADKALARLPSAKDMAAVVDDLISQLTNQDTKSDSVLRNTSGHNQQVGVGEVIDQYADDAIEIDDDIEIDDIEDIIPPNNKIPYVRYVWRVKSRASAAKKTKKKVRDKEGDPIIGGDGKPKMEVVPHISDLVGITVIVPSVDALAHYYLNASGIVKDFNPPQLELTTSRSKDTSFYAKGPKDDAMIKLIEADLGNLGARLDTRISDNGHKVIKITLQYTPAGYEYPIPFEIQFQTDEDRSASRTGPAAHANKSQKYATSSLINQIVKALGDLPKRRERTGTLGLTAQSIKDANEFFPRIEPNQKTQRALGAIASHIQRPQD